MLYNGPVNVSGQARGKFDDKAEPPLPQLNILPSDDENDENNTDENKNADVIIKDEATVSGWEDIFCDVFVTKIETCETG